MNGNDDPPKFTIFYADDRIFSPQFPYMLPKVCQNYIDDSEGGGLEKFMRVFSMTARDEAGQGGFRADVQEVVLMGNTEYLSYNLPSFWSYLKGD